MGRMAFVNYRKISDQEVESIIKDKEIGMRICEICKKYGISETVLIRIVRHKNGFQSKTIRKNEDKIKKLEKKLREREQEIQLLRSALKKY